MSRTRAVAQLRADAHHPSRDQWRLTGGYRVRTIAGQRTMSAHTGPVIPSARVPARAVCHDPGAGPLAAPVGVVGVTIRRLGGGLRWDRREVTADRCWNASAVGEGLRGR